MARSTKGPLQSREGEHGDSADQLSSPPCRKSQQDWEKQSSGGHLVENVPKKVLKSTWVSRSKAGKKTTYRSKLEHSGTWGKRGGQEHGLPQVSFCSA